MSNNDITTEQPEGKDRQRFSIELGDEHRRQLAGYAKSYKLSQGEVLEVLLDRMTLDNELGVALTARREQKVAARSPKKELYQQLKNLTPAQIAAALAAAHQVKE